MVRFGVLSTVGEMVKRVNARARQVQFATARALTRTAQHVREAEKREITAVFDRPTPWALNGLMVKPATRGDLTAEVRPKDARSKSATEFDTVFRHHIKGGTREWKRSEHALRRIGVLPPNMAAVPGEAAQLDAYGNMSRGQIVRLLSYLQAFGEQGYSANSTAKTRARLAKRGRSAAGFSTIQGVEYFVSKGKGNWFGRRSWKQGRLQHLPPGVWSRSGTHGSDLKPVLMFVRLPTYRLRFKFYDVANREIQARFEGELKRSFEEAMASAR